MLKFYTIVIIFNRSYRKKNEKIKKAENYKTAEKQLKNNREKQPYEKQIDHSNTPTIQHYFCKECLFVSYVIR